MIAKSIKLSMLGAALLFTSALKAQTVDEIVESHLKAMGGKDKLGAVKTLSIEGSIQTNGMDLPMTVKTVNGVGSRIELDIMGGKLVQVFSAKSNWALNPTEIGGSGQAEEMPAEAAKGSSSRYELGGAFYNYKDAGKTAKLIGKEILDGKDCFRIDLTTKDGSTTTYFIDDKDFMIVKTVAKIDFQGQEMEVETKFSDYRKINNGTLVCFKRESTQGEQERTITYSKVEADKEIDAKIFDMPK